MFANDSPLAIVLYVVAAVLVLYCIYLILSDHLRGERDRANQLSTPEPPVTVVVERERPRDPVAEAAARWDTLTYREQQVARLAARHLTDAEIAHALTVKTGTVRKYMAIIRLKLGIRKRRELARIIARATSHADKGNTT